MPRMIFANLPVADVTAATAFYEAIGFEKNAAFSSDQGACMVWSETINVMLLSHAFYGTLPSKPIADTHATSAVLICLTCEDRAQVDTIGRAALAAGGRELHGAQDEGFMYSLAFEDLDGHTLQVMQMDMAAAVAAMPASKDSAPI